MTSSQSVNATSQAGFNAHTASNYEKGRPDFDPVHVRRVLDVLVPQGAEGPVVEVGAGSGKFTRPLYEAMQRRFAPQPPQLAVVEPSDMANVLSAANLPVKIVRTSADAMADISTGEASAVVCANSFHWFANEASVNELRRVLRTGGRLGLVFFGGWQQDPFWNAEITRMIEPFYDGSAPHLTKDRGIRPSDFLRWPEVLENSGKFGPPSFETLQGGWTFDEASMIAYVQSFSMVAKQPQDVKDAVADQVRAMLKLPGANAHEHKQGEVIVHHIPMQLRLAYASAL
jgi:SAM-dependent methyltransferase